MAFLVLYHPLSLGYPADKEVIGRAKTLTEARIIARRHHYQNRKGTVPDQYYYHEEPKRLFPKQMPIEKL